MQVDTTTLSGPRLDWAVARIEGIPVKFRHESGVWADTVPYQPSRDGRLGARLLSKHRIGVVPVDEGPHAGGWSATVRRQRRSGWVCFTAHGSTLLEAGLRGLVWLKKGSSVSLPDLVATVA